MNLFQWFQDQLQASAEGLFGLHNKYEKHDNAFSHLKVSANGASRRHIFHMALYEQTYAFPSMRQWLGEAPPSLKGVDEDVAWGEGRDDIEIMLSEFKQLRIEQVALFPKYDVVHVEMSNKTFWERVTLSWVVSKTFQHTAEHTSDVMQIALFWDDVVKWNKSKKQANLTS